MRFAGLRTVAFDGLNSLKVPDTSGNRAWLGKIRHRLGLAGYPALRLMALAETGTRGLLGVAVGSVSERDEARLARRLLHLLGPLVEGGSADAQYGDEVEQTERCDAREPAFLPQGYVVAPQRKLVLPGDGDGVGCCPSGCCRPACVRVGRDGFESFGTRAQQGLLGGGDDDDGAFDGPVGGQRGGVGAAGAYLAPRPPSTK